MKHVVICVVILSVVMGFTTHGIVVVGGESMSPALRKGDVCVYRRNQVVDVGDIVVFRRGDGARVVHRVVEVGSRGALRTKGDASHAVDREQVTSSRVAGPVVWRLPGPMSLMN